MLATAPACRALDLAPRYVTRVTATESLRIPYFVDGSAKYTVYLPNAMTFYEDQGGTAFLFDQLEGATLVMKASLLSPSVPFSKEDVYGKQALQTFSEPAQDIVRQTGGVSLSLPGAENLTLVYDYKLPGRRFVQAVSFVNYSREQQIMLIVTAPADCFEKALSLSTEMLSSWRAVKPGEDLSLAPGF